MRRSPQALDNYLRADALLDVFLDLFEDLAGEDDDGGGAITDLGVLGPGNVDEDSGGGVDNVEELLQSANRILRSCHARARARAGASCEPS